MYDDLQSEIKHLHSEISEKRTVFIDGLRKDIGFKKLKNVYLEIRRMVERLGKCCQQIGEE